ncbi:MAG TPA: ammonium transporter [Archaeoglobus veneficus]|nr:ammonium transporter [Archaeoglobus veneficus]
MVGWLSWSISYACSAIIYAFLVTILAKIIDATIGLRVSEEECIGLDISQHGEVAYTQLTISRWCYGDGSDIFV